MVNDNLTNLFKRPITFETECMSLLGWPGRRQLVQLEHCTNSHPRSFVIFGVTRRSRCDGRHSLTYWLTRLLSVSTDLTDVTLVSDDTYWWLDWYYSAIKDTEDEDDKDDEDNEEDLTDVTQVSDDTYWRLSVDMKADHLWKFSCDENYPVMKVIKCWKLSSGESYLVMKVTRWWKLSNDESYLLMKIFLWWKLSCDERYLVMKVI